MNKQTNKNHESLSRTKGDLSQENGKVSLQSDNEGNTDVYAMHPKWQRSNISKKQKVLDS